METLLHKIEQLKALIVKYNTKNFIQHLAFTLYNIGSRDNNPAFKYLLSPVRQLFYLAYLKINLVETHGDIITIDNKEWLTITKCLFDIETQYFQDIGKLKNSLAEGDFEKIMAMAPTYANYFFNGHISYIEQDIEKVNGIIRSHETTVVKETGFTVDDFINFFNDIDNLIIDKLNAKIKYFKPDVWQAFTQSCIDKGVTEPKEWIKYAPEDLIESMNFLKNGGIILTVNFDIDFEKPKGEKYKKIADLLCCEQNSVNDVIYYTDDNLLREKPVLKFNEEYIFLFHKDTILSIYKFLFSLCRNNNDPILKSRDKFTENKTLQVFQKYLGRDAHYYTNYYVNNDNSEHDILILYKRHAFIIEVKAGGYREPFRNPLRGFDRLKSDFKKTIQEGFDQTTKVINEFATSSTIQIKNNKHHLLYSINPDKYVIHSIVVTLERFGVIQTDLNNLLDIDEKYDFPWCVNLDDLEVFLLTLKAQKIPFGKFLLFLEYRELYHGHLACTDELELCGIFIENEKDYIRYSISNEIISTDNSTTAVFEQQYRDGMGFNNERRFAEKVHKEIGFIY